MDTVSLAEFEDRVVRAMQPPDNAEAQPTAYYLELCKLWNTVLHYETLQNGPPFNRFYLWVRDERLPDVVEALNMNVARGFALYAPEHDVYLGGVEAPQYRYQIDELEMED